ncbi:MAG: hypothetical protein SO365_06885 [Prevotella sp.]|nr:hypothetical protein [Prevotella sp.]
MNKSLALQLRLVPLRNAVQKYRFFLNYPNNLITFAKNQQKMRDKILRFIGLPWVYAGVALLAASYIFTLTHYDWLLFVGLFLIVGGTLGALYKEKRRSHY